MEKQTFTAVYPQQMRPSRYDGAHFLCYLNESPAEYKADEDAEPTAGFAYTGPMTDGGTLVECDEWERNKLINAVLRTRYLQTEEDAVKTHRLQLLASKVGMAELPDEKGAEYAAERILQTGYYTDHAKNVRTVFKQHSNGCQTQNTPS